MKSEFKVKFILILKNPSPQSSTVFGHARAITARGFFRTIIFENPARSREARVLGVRVLLEHTFRTRRGRTLVVE